MAFTIVDLEDMPVACVEARNGPSGAIKAFRELESRLDTLKGKRFYGVYYTKEGRYLSCMRSEKGNDSLGFETAVIPGGKYARKRIKDWVGKEHLVGSEFDELRKECEDSGYEIEDERPSIEFYRSERELFLLLPIK